MDAFTKLAVVLVAAGVTALVRHLVVSNRLQESLVIEINEAFSEATDTAAYLSKLFEDELVQVGSPVKVGARYYPRKQRIFESSVSDLPKHLSSDHLKRVVRAYNAIYEVDELATGLFTDLREYQETEEELKIEGYGLLRRKQERLWSIVMQMNDNTVATLHDLPKNFDATFPASWVIDRS